VCTNFKHIPEISYVTGEHDTHATLCL